MARFETVHRALNNMIVSEKAPLLQKDLKVQRADLTCDVIRKVAPFVLSKL